MIKTNKLQKAKPQKGRGLVFQKTIELPVGIRYGTQHINGKSKRKILRGWVYPLLFLAGFFLLAVFGAGRVM